MNRGTTIERQAVALWTANALDFALQILLPVVLARTLSVESFAHYRLLWLSVATVMTLTPLGMPYSLYYFLPRSDAATKRLYINQTLVFLALAGIVSAWILSPWDPWLPQTMRDISSHEGLVPAFVLLWIVASLLDLLPTAEARVKWQANTTVGLSALRAVSMSAAAVLTHELDAVLLTLLGFVVFKLALLLAYLLRHHGLRGPVLRPAAFGDQIRYAAPFGISGALHGLRGQTDQWVVAALFPLSQFAAFSVAAVISPMVTLFRQSCSSVFLPSMSRMQSNGEVNAMLGLNNRANMLVAAITFPLLAFCFVFADPLITLIYTSAYREAVPVMRVYVACNVIFVVELNSMLMLYRQGGFALRVNLLALVVSVPMSIAGALLFGLPGAVAGNVSSILVGRLVTLRRVSTLTGVGMRKLQDWKGLVSVLVAASASAAVAAALIWKTGFAPGHPLVELAAGAACIALAYSGALFLVGQRRLLTDLIGLVLHPRQPASSPITE